MKAYEKPNRLGVHSFHCNLHLILTEVIDMNDQDEVIQAISIGLIVAYFLLNTNRVLKSIEICKECLAIFKQKAGIKDDKLAKSLSKMAYLIMLNAYRAINDNTNVVKYAKKFSRFTVKVEKNLQHMS